MHKLFLLLICQPLRYQVANLEISKIRKSGNEIKSSSQYVTPRRKNKTKISFSKKSAGATNGGIDRP